jgi:hypothetical protein
MTKIIPDWIMSPKYWLSLFLTFGIINFIIIFFRLSIREKNFNFNYDTLSFIAWLQLQILAFYVLILSVYPIIMGVYNLLLIVKDWLVTLFSKRKTNRIMKWLDLIITDYVIYKSFCIFVIVFYLYIIHWIIFLYGSMVYFGTIMLLGYTQI